MSNSEISNKEDKGSSENRLTTKQLREFYAKYSSRIEQFERSKTALQLLNPATTTVKTFSTFSKETLRTYLMNPLQNYKNLRNLSRFLYYRSQIYRRLVHYNANMIDLNFRSVIPIVDFTKSINQNKMLKSYYETLSTLEKMNLPLEFLKVYVTCWREDIFYGCAYYDDEGFFILPLDPDYCVVTGIYPTGDLAFDMDMSYFSRKEEILEMWGEPFMSMYKEYQKDTSKNRWQPMPDENCVCLKVNMDNWEVPLVPYMAMFNSLINLEDLNEITAIADEQQIYKLLIATIPLLKNTNQVNDFAVDIDLAIDFYNKMMDNVPDYTNGIITPVEIKEVSFDHDQASDVNKIENATKSVLNTSGGAQVLNSSNISGTTAWGGAIKADEEYALSSLLPQTQAWLERFLSYHVNEPAKVKFMEVTKYTKEEYKDSLRRDATYGVPVKLELNTLNGFTELETISKAYLEQALDIQSLFIPLQSSNTMDTGELGRPTAKEGGKALTDDGENSIDKRDKS